MDNKQMLQLLKQAREARKQAYAPYSGFTVGAALLSSDGRLFTGCNIENTSFTPTCCAERVALFKAVSEGYRNFNAIAVAGGFHGKEESECAPCGVCRQVMSEFCGEDFSVILGTKDGYPMCISLGELLPHGFKLKTE